MKVNTQKIFSKIILMNELFAIKIMTDIKSTAHYHLPGLFEPIPNPQSPIPMISLSPNLNHKKYLCK